MRAETDRFVPVAVGSDATLVGGSGSDILFAATVFMPMAAMAAGPSWSRTIPACQMPNCAYLVANNHSLFGQDDSQEATTALMAAQAMTFCTVRKAGVMW